MSIATERPTITFVDHMPDAHERRIAEYVRRLVDSAPPLTPEQGDRIAMLLRASDDGKASAA